VLVVQQSLRVGAPLGAIAVCEAARGLGLNEPAVELAEATVRFSIGEMERALAMVESVLETSPEHLVALNLKAHMLIPLSRHAESLSAFQRVVDRFPDFPGAQGAISSLLLPGPPYRDVLARIHRVLRPDTYLEIGVETGATLGLATTATAVAGVDPAQCSSPDLLPPAARFYRMESDAFFSTESRESVFGGRAVDLTFIDGMHWFEYALRDFVNAERWAGENGAILLHDCLPVTRVAARRDRASSFWVGDVWKVLEALLDHRPDLRITVVPTAPSGLVVVRGLDPGSTVLSAAMGAIVQSYRDREYPHAPGEWPERYCLVDNDDAGLARALR
jgi:tetratricopeptide (TPR) repeat protein